MIALTSFPDDLACPTKTEIKALKKSRETPEKALNEIKGAKQLANEEKIIPQRVQPFEAQKEMPKPDIIQLSSSGGVDEHLPNLKPDRNGKVDWTPLGAMTGTRPDVNKYSVSRYSLSEWRNHNARILDTGVINESNIVDYNAKTAIMQAFGNIDKHQLENNKRLKQKARDIFRWKVEVEEACKAIKDETEKLEIGRQRLKGASRVLMFPESISKECLELRSNRPKPDLVADLAQQELIKEMELVNEVRTTLENTLGNIEKQMAVNKAAKHRIEFDWCDKTMAYNTEAINLSLNAKSKTLMFRPGSTRFGQLTAPLEYWEFFCRENIQNCEATRQQSADLRSGLDDILVNNGRKLRSQADRTDIVLAETVAITTELCTKLEENLKITIQKTADMETLIENLKHSIRKTDAAMKLAQTRLDNRNNWRLHGESVRDQPHVGLIEEVKKIHETVTSLLGQLSNAERLRRDLMRKRTELEEGIAAKRKCVNIDRDRCGKVRSHYPSALELAGSCLNLNGL